MSDGTVYNLLRNSDLTRHELSAVAAATTGKAATYMPANWGNAANPAYDSAGMHFVGPTAYGNANSGVGIELAASDLGLVKGETYALSVEAARLAAASGNNGVTVWQYASEGSWWTGKATRSKWLSGAGVYHTSFAYDGSAYVYLLMSVGVAGSVTVTRIGLYHAASAAWAPAEGETLAGGGALMSANLWDVSAANLKPDADGVYNVGKTAGELSCSIAGASALTENQTIHMGASLRGADKGCLKPFVGYKDAAGNLNWTGFPAWTPTDQWQRFEGSYVVPSGMTLTYFGFNVSAATGDIEVMNPAWSYGSPVTLASSAHTPYATQDHVSTVYATKASLKVTDDSIKAEVSARAQTDQTVSDLSSRLTQTASGLSASISKLSETDKKVNAWFDFEADSSGNPQLKMGSSTSPVVGTYTNSGLAYRSRDGATIMELDASRSATISDHMEAQDMRVGKWKWIQTQDGTHLTLVWAG